MPAGRPTHSRFDQCAATQVGGEERRLGWVRPRLGSIAFSEHRSVSSCISSSNCDEGPVRGVSGRLSINTAFLDLDGRVALVSKRSVD